MAEAIDTKKTISIINAFSAATAEFLNHFCAKAHKRISAVNRQIERLEALTALLEYKVNSLPEDFSVPPPQPVQSNPVEVKEGSEVPVQAEPEQSKPAIPDEFKGYIRMLNVGVPRQAVKHKMSVDGHDPNKLDEIMPPTDD